MEYRICKYFESIGDGSCGYCHRFPPQNDGKGENTIDEFPLVKKGCWCGEGEWDEIDAKKGKKK